MHQKCTKSASKVHQKCIKSASKVHQKCTKSVSLLKAHQKCIKNASKVHQKCIKSASKVHQKCIKIASKVHQKCIMFLTMFKHFSEKASLDRWKNKIPLWNWKWSKGLTKTSWLHPFKPAKGLQRFHPDLLQIFLMRRKMPQESMSFLLSWVLKQASLQTPWANFYVIWSMFVASIPELRRLGLTKTSWLYPFKPAKGLQGFHPDLLQFFWWDKKVPLESMSFLSNWVLKQACLQFPWTIFFYLWDFTKFHLPKKISRFFFCKCKCFAMTS